MGFQADLYAALSGNAGLTALIGTRLYPNEAPQDPTLPYVVYYEFATPREQLMDCSIGVSKPRIQYSIYAETYSSALAVADALRPALLGSGFMVVLEDERGSNDMTSGINRRDIDARIVHVGA
jgi:hypothetical protein